jgi:hypothetical protein
MRYIYALTYVLILLGSAQAQAHEGKRTVVNGACGSSNGADLTSAPTTNLCSAGTASAVSGSGPWSWSCAGSNGGTTAICSANDTTPVNGACGSANGVAVSTAPTSGLCTTGSASAVSGSGPWNWSCAGSNGGSTATCSAPLSSASDPSGSGGGGGTSAIDPGPSASLFSSNPYYTCVNNYYVSASSSGGAGTSGNPWNLSTAINQSLAPGSCVNMSPGTYTVTGVNPLSFSYGGTGPAKNQYVVWRCTTMPFSFSGGVLQGEGTGCHIIQSGSQGGSLIAELTAYIMFDGIEFDGNAFAVESDCIQTVNTNAGHHHIWIMNSDIHGCGQSGLQLNQTDWLFAIHNVWHDNSATNGADGSGQSFWEPYTLPGYTPTAGNPDYWHSTVTGRTYNMVVAYNVAYHNYNNFSGATDGECFNMDTFQNEPYSGNVLIMGNIAYGCGGEGIEVEYAAGMTGHIDIINNTTYSNAWDTNFNGTWGAGIYAQDATNVTVWNNIIIEGTAGRSCTNSAPCTTLDQGSTAGADNWQTNMSYTGGQTLFDGNNTYPTTGTNHNIDGMNPLLASLKAITTVSGTGASNFALCTAAGVPASGCTGASPAIGAGQAFDLWQQSSGPVDVGACVHTLTSCP